MVENIELQSIYGVDDDIDSCPKCSNTDLKNDVIKTTLSDLGISKNWYCAKCKIVWIKGLKQPKYQP